MSSLAHRTEKEIDGAASKAALSIRQISKKFGGVVALNEVDLDVAPGEVHGLLGTNGSGKSTLIKILSGFHDPEPGGRAWLHGQRMPLPLTGRQALELGLAFVHQHLGLIPSLTVTENLRLNRIASEPHWAISWREEHRRAEEVFASYGLAIDPRARVRDLSAVQRALLAIVRAVEDLRHATGGKQPGVLVLDEPTPFLPRAGVEQLFGLVRQVVDEGASVIFVSHDIDEVLEICDRATILRDGNLAGTVNVKTSERDDFVSRIIGKSVSVFHVARNDGLEREKFLAVEGLTAPNLGPISFAAGKGEILGFTGLIGSGSERVPSLLYGSVAAEGGQIILGTKRAEDLAAQTPSGALDNHIAFLPADRLGAAGIGSLPMTDNVTLPVLNKLRSAWGLERRRMMAETRRLGAEFGVKPNLPSLPLASLSGGNQQKALMAKWLQIEPLLLLLDEPTQGVDVSARQQLFAALDAASANGTTIIMASTDYEQLEQICHRVIVMGRGKIVAELTGSQLTKDSIAQYCYRSRSGVN